MTTRTLRVTLLALALGATGLSAQTGRGPKEPTFQDRGLSAWVDDLKGLAPYTRNQAAYAIGGMGPAARSAVPALIEALKDPEATVRFPVCIALGEIGPDAIAAVPALREALDDRNDDVGAMARKAIIKITGEDPRPFGEND
ncbi:MAG: HEAT repeat domain-containing protein [Gemmatimonadales bacterium]|jgi:HEAT repeat protein|nr:HEAT repeat domain-containing protein [Gemmatimonadales bacterium]